MCEIYPDSKNTPAINSMINWNILKFWKGSEKMIAFLMIAFFIIIVVCLTKWKIKESGRRICSGGFSFFAFLRCQWWQFILLPIGKDPLLLPVLFFPAAFRPWLPLKLFQWYVRLLWYYPALVFFISCQSKQYKHAWNVTKCLITAI